MDTPDETTRAAKERGSMSETVIYVCTIPAVPPSLNEWQRMHWAKQERARKEFQEMAWAVLSEKGNRCPRGLAYVDVHAVLMFPEDRRRDSSNFGAVLWKLFLDVLVREGVIPDDTADHVACHDPRLLSGGKPLTVITIEQGGHGG